MPDPAAANLVATLWRSWLENRLVGSRTERERAFWAGYALGRRQAARQAAHALGVADPAKRADAKRNP